MVEVVAVGVGVDVVFADGADWLVVAVGGAAAALLLELGVGMARRMITAADVRVCLR